MRITEARLNKLTKIVEYLKGDNKTPIPIMLGVSNDLNLSEEEIEKRFIKNGYIPLQQLPD